MAKAKQKVKPTAPVKMTPPIPMNIVKKGK